jgi:uncharacterized protein YjbI with pentapeptide repeats
MDAETTAIVENNGSQSPEQDGERRKNAILEKLQARREDGSTGSAGGEPLEAVTLIGEDLSGMDLSGCDLSGAELSRANLTNANLSWCRLNGATLYQTKLDGCEFMGADLSKANMNECSANRAGFGGAILDGANIIHANFEGATLSNARLRDADFTTANLRGARLREADLTHANFNKAILCNADFEGATVGAATFDGADLRSAHLKRLARFEKASWISADIRDVDFTGAYMVRRFIMDQNYLYEFRKGSRHANFVYLIWWATSDCGRSFARWALWTALVALVFAGLYGFVDVQYGPHKTIFSSIYYSVVTLTTLGYGDVLPVSLPAQILAMVEVGIGYLALGGLLSIFANKMARRAD